MGQKVEIITRSLKNGEKLTHYERNFISRNAKCPDCESGDLVEGPHGGMSINYCCNNDKCGSKFNFAVFGPEERIVFAERISAAQPKKT